MYYVLLIYIMERMRSYSENFYTLLHYWLAPPDEIEEVRLADKYNDTIGRLEVRVRGEWGTACSDGFDWTAAHFMCQGLGFR